MRRGALRAATPGKGSHTTDLPESNARPPLPSKSGSRTASGSASVLQVAGDELAHHLVGAVGHRAGPAGPLVLALGVELVAAVAARRAVGGGKLLLYRRQHIVVELALHDEHGLERHRFLALEHLLRVRLVDRLPGHQPGVARPGPVP